MQIFYALPTVERAPMNSIRLMFCVIERLNLRRRKCAVVDSHIINKTIEIPCRVQTCYISDVKAIRRANEGSVYEWTGDDGGGSLQDSIYVNRLRRPIVGFHYWMAREVAAQVPSWQSLQSHTRLRQSTAPRKPFPFS